MDRFDLIVGESFENYVRSFHPLFIQPYCQFTPTNLTLHGVASENKAGELRAGLAQGKAGKSSDVAGLLSGKR